jgi:hypothetical protein
VDEIMPLYPWRHPYGLTASEVQVAGSVLLPGVRQWLEARRSARTAGAPASPRGAVRRLAGRPHARAADTCGNGSGLPDAPDAVTDGRDHLSARVFRDVLLSAPGSEFALGPPDGPAALLSRACLFLSCRKSSVPDEHHATRARPPR